MDKETRERIIQDAKRIKKDYESGNIHYIYGEISNFLGPIAKKPHYSPELYFGDLSFRHIFLTYWQLLGYKKYGVHFNDEDFEDVMREVVQDNICNIPFQGD